MNATSLCCTDTFPQFDTSHQLSDIFMVSHKITLPRSQTTHGHALLCLTYSQPSLLRFFRVTPFLSTSLWTYWTTIAYVFLQCVPPALSRIIPAHILCVCHQCLWGMVTAPIRCPRSTPQDRERITLERTWEVAVLTGLGLMWLASKAEEGTSSQGMQTTLENVKGRRMHPFWSL